MKHQSNLIFIWIIPFFMGMLSITSCKKDNNDKLPVVLTKSVTLLEENTLIVESKVTSEGGAPILFKGQCWSSFPQPTVENGNTIFEGTGVGNFSSSIQGLNYLNIYYVRSFATNNYGTSYGEEKIIRTSIPIGTVYQGGIVVYIYKPEDNFVDQNGQPQTLFVEGETHGLIAAEQNILSGIWACGAEANSPGIAETNPALGRGKYNTQNIISFCDDLSAAKSCSDLELNGYSDWFLPSTMELHLFMHQQLATESSLQGYYWTSTEHNFEKAFTIGLQSDDLYLYIGVGAALKTIERQIRPFRNF